LQVSALVNRWRAARKLASAHLIFSVMIGVSVTGFLLAFWYPNPYGRLADRDGLFLLIVGSVVAIGPLLTMVLFSPSKSSGEILLTFALIALIQIGVQSYGVYSAYLARPLFLVHEIDRFRLVARPDFLDVDVEGVLKELPFKIRPGWSSTPVLVGVRAPTSQKEREMILLESASGGRDLAQRPELYVNYDDIYAQRVIHQSFLVSRFVTHFPGSASEVSNLLLVAGIPQDQARYVPVVSKEDWIALLDRNGFPMSFVQGDGFAPLDNARRL
jgi:hypothetical protein